MKRRRRRFIVLLLSLIIFLSNFRLTGIAAAVVSPQTPPPPQAPSSPALPQAPDLPQQPLPPAQPVTASASTPPAEDTSASDVSAAPALSGESSTTADNLADSASSQPVAPASSPASGTSLDNQVGTDPYIATGNATANGTLVNNGNLNSTVSPNGSQLSDGQNSNLVNAANGPDSQNSNAVSLQNSTSVQQNNSIQSYNSLGLDSSSGFNSTSHNTNSDSTIITGDANTTGTIVNYLNTNLSGVSLSEFNITDDTLGDIILDFSAACVAGCSGPQLSLDNSQNASQSANSNQVTIIDDSLAFQNNEINLQNHLILSANTGGNLADFNTGGSSTITTGNANVSGNVVNFLNNNMAGRIIYGVVNIFADLTGNLIIPDNLFPVALQSPTIQLANADNGSGSTNNNTVTLTDRSDISQFNTVDLNNDIQLLADTGNNLADQNTGGTVAISTGGTSISGQVINVANTNVVGGNWWIVLVNQAGTWLGKIIGSPQGSTFAGSPGSEFTVAADGTINVTNSGNGQDSTNTNTVTLVNDTTTVQTNQATVTNTIALTSNSGANSTSHNTNGNSSITTGDANIMLNLVNFINNNFHDANVLLTVVNVFGSWFGDLVPPGQEPEQTFILDVGGDQPDPETAVDPTSSEDTPVVTVTDDLAVADPTIYTAVVPVRAQVTPAPKISVVNFVQKSLTPLPPQASTLAINSLRHFRSELGWLLSLQLLAAVALAFLGFATVKPKRELSC